MSWSYHRGPWRRPAKWRSWNGQGGPWPSGMCVQLEGLEGGTSPLCRNCKLPRRSFGKNLNASFAGTCNTISRRKFSESINARDVFMLLCRRRMKVKKLYKRNSFVFFFKKKKIFFTQNRWNLK